MKTTQIMKGVLLSLLLLLPFGILIAQAIEPPTDVIDLVVRFDVFIASLAGYAAVAIFLTGLINGWSKITKSWMKQVISWVVPVILVVVVSFLLKAGFLAGENFIKVLIFGLGAGLVSNGIFDISFVNTFIGWVVEKVGGVIKKE
jgi:hypothetical protein